MKTGGPIQRPSRLLQLVCSAHQRHGKRNEFDLLQAPTWRCRGIVYLPFMTYSATLGHGPLASNLHVYIFRAWIRACCREVRDVLEHLHYLLRNLKRKEEEEEEEVSLAYSGLMKDFRALFQLNKEAKCVRGGRERNRQLGRSIKTNGHHRVIPPKQTKN